MINSAFSAYLCVLCVGGRFKTQRSQRAAEKKNANAKTDK